MTAIHQTYLYPYHYVVGADPTATTNAFPIPANTPIFVGVVPGHNSVIAAS